MKRCIRFPENQIGELIFNLSKTRTGQSKKKLALCSRIKFKK